MYWYKPLTWKKNPGLDDYDAALLIEESAGGYKSLRPRLILEEGSVGFYWNGHMFKYVNYECSKPIALAYHQDWTDYNKRVIQETLDLTKNREQVIPKGVYCYEYREWRKNEEHGWNEPVRESYYKCPFWDYDMARGKQGNGYCHLMHSGDWNGHMLLWDQCKECGFNYDDDDDEE